MKSTILFSLMALVVAVVGCATTPKSPREAFLSRIPDRTNYFRCYEVSIESLRAEEERILRLTHNFARSAREATTNCPTCPALQEGLARIERVADTLHKPHVEFMRQLEAAYNPKTDTILFFHYWVGDTQDYGYILTCDGVVKRRFNFDEEKHD